MICKHCSGQIPDDSNFCPRCGNVPAATTTSPVQTAAPLPPTPAIPATAPAQAVSTRLPASAWRRFFNYLVDGLIVYVLIIIVSAVFSVTDASGLIVQVLLSILVVVTYYSLCESLLQRTAGKFLTGTKVVSFDGSKPAFADILIRSLVRHVPFEQITFLTSHPAGWHDRWSKTLVVPTSYSPADVAMIHVANLKKVRVWIVIFFILLIPVTGIIASVVLASLNTARTKVRDTIRVVDVKSLQLALELYYSDHAQFPASLEELAPTYLGDGVSPTELPLDPLSKTPYSYQQCGTSDYHIGASLETNHMALATDLDMSAKCSGDPIDGDDGGPCVTTDAGSHCFDVDGSTPNPTGA